MGDGSWNCSENGVWFNVCELWMPWLICTTVHEIKRSCGIMDFMILGYGMDGQGKKALDMFSPMWFRFW